MKILVTGNLGYIGSVLTEVLKSKGHSVRGYDTGYYESCILFPPEEPDEQIRKDIRDIAAEDIEGCQCVIHLAALSNDPLGELTPHLTEEINLQATVRAADLAKRVGVQRFVFASSQSMYGFSDSEMELEEDTSEKRPLTSYARTKWEAECAIKTLDSEEFTVTCFRPSTVFGASPRLRCDIVFNNLLACAFTTGKIEIRSDGTPWRPVVHIRDVCQAFLAGMEAPRELVGGRSFNVGIPNGNFTVKELAVAAQRQLSGCSLVFTGEHGTDSRTYRVSFKRILTDLASFFHPRWDLDTGGKELADFFRATNFSESDFRGEKTIRLQRLRRLLDSGELDDRLFWNSRSTS